jgi:hypothetical protein
MVNKKKLYIKKFIFQNNYEIYYYLTLCYMSKIIYLP